MALDPGLQRDLGEAKGALARHGIVIIRAIETELEPAIMSAAKNSMASSPGKLDKMDADELDKFTEKLRRIALNSAEELKELYVRLLAKLGNESAPALVVDLEGIGELFKWGRIQESIHPVDRELESKGFAPATLDGPGDLSEGFELEVEQRWPPAFERFKSLVEEAARRQTRAFVRVPALEQDSPVEANRSIPANIKMLSARMRRMYYSLTAPAVRPPAI